MDVYSNGKRNRYIVLMICLTVALPAVLFGQTTHTVKLSRQILSDSSKYHGSKALEFVKPAAGTVAVPPHWSALETAVIIENPRLRPTVIARFHDDKGVVRYAVADDGGTVFDSTSVLSFHLSGDRQIADLTITVQPEGKSDTTLKQFAGKIFLSKDRVIARLAECREGTLRIGNRDYDICIYASSINNPFYDLSTDAVCLIDMNRDGTYSWIWQIDDSIGTIIPSERIVLTKPFSIDGHKLKALSIDSAGTMFTCSDYPGDTAAVIGFFAPGFSFTDLDGINHTLADMKGRVVLVTFWSGKCPYCEKIRPRLDTLVLRYDTTRFQAISAVIDSDRVAIMKFLQNRPYGGIIVPYNAPLWNMYNSRKTTPVYYVIDPDGAVVFSGTGASAFTIVERIVADKLSSHQ